MRKLEVEYEDKRQSAAVLLARLGFAPRDPALDISAFSLFSRHCRMPS